MLTLEEMMRRKADHLRGRPETRWDRVVDALRCVDWGDVVMTILLGVAASVLILAEALLIAALLSHSS